MCEIGSEFSSVSMEKGHGLDCPPGTFTFSGRTALEMILEDIGERHKALLPSYLCDSVITPFRKKGMEYSFYDVFFDEQLKIVLEIPEDADVLLWCNYFGFRYDMPDLSAFIRRGGIIIEDITHSFYSKKRFNDQSHYLAASLRKWEPVLCGGYCSITRELPPPPESFLTGRRKAMDLKTGYLSDNDMKKKEEFLQMFRQCNEWLGEHYSGLGMDPYSREYISCVDYIKHRDIRRKNAGALFRGLKNRVRFLFREEEMDCPLFVPVILENRDEIRKKLIDNKVYCPVHWPQPKDDCKSNLYNLELSLICDHRYTENDMGRIIDIIY